MHFKLEDSIMSTKLDNHLSSKATLIAVEGRVWKETVYDGAATASSTAALSTTKNWGSFYKRLIDPAVFKPVAKVLAASRHYVNGNSAGVFDGKFIPGGLPEYEGKRLLPNLIANQVKRNLDSAVELFYEELDKAALQLPDAVARAKLESPELLKDYDFPSVEEILTKRFSINIWQGRISPDANTFIDGVSKEFGEEVHRQHKERESQALRDVTTGIANTIVSVAGHFSDVLGSYDPEARGGAPFRESTVEKIRDLVPVIRAMNVEGDARLDQAATDLTAALGNKSGEELRHDDDERKATADAARKIANNIDSFFN